MSSMKCVDCKRTECECKDKCFDSLVERKFLVPISEADDEKSHGVAVQVVFAFSECPRTRRNSFDTRIDEQERKRFGRRLRGRRDSSDR